MEPKDILNKLLAYEDNCAAVQPGGKDHDLRSMMIDIILDTPPEEWSENWISWLIDIVASPTEYFPLVIKAADALRQAVEAGNTTAVWWDEDILDAVKDAENNFPLPIVLEALSKLRACLTPGAADGASPRANQGTVKS